MYVLYCPGAILQREMLSYGIIPLEMLSHILNTKSEIFCLERQSLRIWGLMTRLKKLNKKTKKSVNIATANMSKNVGKCLVMDYGLRVKLARGDV